MESIQSNPVVKTIEPTYAARLAEQVRHGNSHAEYEVVARYRQPLVAFLRQRGCHNDSEDYADEALMLLLTKMRSGQLKQPERWVGYVYGVAGNLWRAEQRKLARRKTDTNQDVDTTAVTQGQSSSDKVFSIQALKQLLAAIEEMSTQRDRTLLVRFYLLEHDKSSICADLGMTATQFDRVSHRARGRLRQTTRRTAPELEANWRLA